MEYIAILIGHYTDTIFQISGISMIFTISGITRELLEFLEFRDQSSVFLKQVLTGFHKKYQNTQML